MVEDRWIICLLAIFLCSFVLISLVNFNQNASADMVSKEHHSLNVSTQDELGRKCDIFDGRWIYEAARGGGGGGVECPFLGTQVSCKRNGRPDHHYEKWRWVANDCEIPKFNGTDFLERLRGKRLIIVGDSLNRNQFESLSCLLYSSIPASKRNNAAAAAASYVHSDDEHKIFRAKPYNCTLEFYWSPFLVELDETRLLKLDTLHPSATNWRGADIMIFNTGHWWAHTGKLQVWDHFQSQGMLVENLNVETAFKTALKSWARWIDRNVDPTKTTVFFRSISPEHKGKQWCYNQTQPIQDESYVQLFPRQIIEIVETTITEMKTPVRYLNITKLSQYRKDAHPSVYTARKGKLLTAQQRMHPKLNADCSHWCIPGVPDTWNSLVYASIALDTSHLNTTNI